MPHKPDLSSELLDAVRQLYAVIERFDAFMAGRLGVDRSSLRAINAMESGAISPGKLGELLDLSSGSVTALLDRLENGGHIERQRSDKDGRRRNAMLNPATREAAHSRYSELGRLINEAFGDLGPEELQQSMFAIRELAKCFDKSCVKDVSNGNGINDTG